MNGKTLALTGALTLSLLVPAGAAVAAPADDHPGPLGGILNVFGDHDRKDRKKHDDNGFHFGRNHDKRFVVSGTIRGINPDDRTVRVGHGKRGGDSRVIWVDDDAKIWRNGDRAKFGDLKKGDHVRMTGTKKHGKWVATRVRADN
jgi:hypothetical protein